MFVWRTGDQGFGSWVWKRFLFSDCVCEGCRSFIYVTWLEYSAVFLRECDTTINAHAIGEYLTRDRNLTAIENRGREVECKTRWWTGGEMDIL